MDLRAPRGATRLAEVGWREFLEAMGVSAAIMSFTAATPEAGRHAYLVGLDEARSDPQLVDGLLHYAESAWRGADDAGFHPFQVTADENIAGAHPAFATDRSPGRLALRPFDHAAILQGNGNSGTWRALLLRASGDGDFDAPCQRTLMAATPMFLEAAATHAASTRHERHSELLEAMFDRVSLAVMLVDADARPIFCNDAARTLLDARDPLLRAADGNLACNGAAETKRLRTSIRSVATASNDDTEAVLRLGTTDGNWRMTFVVPARAGTSGGLSRCAMVLVDTRRPCEAPGPLLHALGLLPSEQRFLNAFLRSNSIGEAAGQSGLSEETARTYLKRVRAKLGVHRQMELAQLIYGLVPPLRQPAAWPLDQR